MGATDVVDLDTVVGRPLALHGGPKAVADEAADAGLFAWPILTDDDDRAVLDALHSGQMSGTNIAMQFEDAWAAFNGTRYALSYPSGTMALLVAMHVAGVGRGHELICPSITYWASCLQAYALGATVAFADIDPRTLCIDPADIERHITPRTRAIMVVHYCGHPCDMDAILPIARRHGLKVIEDVSHAHGALYRGRMVGTFGDVAAMSMMSGKAFPVGEGGMLVTDDAMTFERAISFAHYARHGHLTDPDLKAIAGLPTGGLKGRLVQLCAALGLSQLSRFPQRMRVIQDAMNRFWDLLEGTPGLRPHRTPPGTDTTMGGWYNPAGHYLPDELGGLPVAKFAEAVCAEGARCGVGVNAPLHLHPVMNDVDIHGDGKPTRIAFTGADIRQPKGSLPVAEAVMARALTVPWFKHDDAERIALYAAAYRKVALQAERVEGGK